MSKHRMVIVLGMHRSGTSAITKGLACLGVELGRNLVPSQPDNPAGFWEDLEVNKLCDSILNCLGMTWHSLDWIQEYRFDHPGIDAGKQSGRRLLLQRISEYELWGFKNPRTVRILPFWQSLFAELEIDDRYLIVFRNPLSVANSLARRDKFSDQKSLRLWLQHTLLAIQGTMGKQRIVVEFDDFMEDPIGQLRKVAEDLNLPIGSAENIDTYARYFLNREMVHNRFQQADLETASVSELIKRLYRCLHKVARGSQLLDSPAVQKELNAIGRECILATKGNQAKETLLARH